MGCYQESSPSPTEGPGSGGDADGDGWTVAAGDCDDHDAGISPAQTEVCDPQDRDENCNGLADNEDPNADPQTRTTYHHDVDRDGYGDAASARSFCDDPTVSDDWWTTDARDCDDRRASVHPGAPEVCDNGLDDDCNGEVDEGACGTPAPTPTPGGGPTPGDEPTPPDHPTPGEGTEPEATLRPGETPTDAPTPTKRPPIEPRTPRPTPTQIPPPSDEWQGFTRLEVAPKGQGLDYDGDGTLDNAVYDALEAVQDQLITIVNTAVDSMTDFPDQDDPCEEEPEGSCLSPPQGQAAKAAARQVIVEHVSVQTLNDALISAFDVATTPWAVHFTSTKGQTTLGYYAGSVQQIGGSYGFKAERPIGSQAGVLHTDGSPSTFGPGVFHITVVVEDPEGGAPTVVGFDVEDALTRMTYGDASTVGALTGGAVQVSAFVSLVESVLTSLGDSGLLPDDFDVDAAIDQATDGIVSACDLTCSSSQEPCFSISLVYDAETLSQAFPPL